MSMLLEPGEPVRWKHDGGWKVGRVLMEYNAAGPYCWYVIQCPEGIYDVYEPDVEPHPMRSEWEGEE